MVQLYIHEEHPGLVRPEKELKGFQRVSLRPGESRQVMIQLDPAAFSYFNDHKMRWVTDPGHRFDILVGSSSRDIRLKGSLTM